MLLKSLKTELIPTLKLAIPMIGTQLLNYGQQIIDTVMAGRHSALTLSGVSLANQLFALVYLLMSGVGIGFSAYISRHHGAEDSTAVRRHFQQGLWLFLGMSLLTVLLTLLCAYLPYVLGSQADIAAQSNAYLLILALPAGIFVFAGVARYFMEGMASPRMINIVQACLLPVNALGNYVFLTYTDWGAAGMAVSTAICYLLYFILLLGILLKDKRWRHYRLFSRISRPRKDILYSLIAVGLPIGVAIMMEVGMFAFISVMASRSSAIMTGANQIAGNYLGVMFMIPLGMSAALTIRTANALGRDDWQAIRDRSIAGLLFCTIFMLSASVAMYFLRAEIAAIYTKDLQIIALAVQILLIMAFFQLADGLQVAATGILRGLGDTRIILGFAMFGYWIIGIPVGCLLFYGFDMGIIGLWIGCALGLFIFAALAIHRVFKHLQRHGVLYG